MNILFASNDRLKVCDLGIVTDHAIIYGEDGIESVQSRTFSKGTPLYMAPEQVNENLLPYNESHFDWR